MEIVLYVSYGRWSAFSAIHAFTKDAHKLCDKIRPRYGLEMGRAGDFDDITCKRCKAKIKALKKKGHILVDGYMIRSDSE